MSAYISFGVVDEGGQQILIEVDEKSVAGGKGIKKAGLASAAGSVIAEANQQFKNAVAAVIGANTDAFVGALSSLQNPPSSAEISFGLKVSGEVGNFVITKIAAEGNYAVKLTWTSK
jgi:hypothetical protein